MPIEFNCHVCGKMLRTSDEKAGRTAACPGCGEKLNVPGEKAKPEAAFDDYPAKDDDDDDGFDDYDDGEGFDDDEDFESSSAGSAPRQRSRQHSRSRRSSSQNPLALISMICGITGLVVMVPGFCCGCFFLLSIPLDLAAIIMGGALWRAKRENESPARSSRRRCGSLAAEMFRIPAVSPYFCDRRDGLFRNRWARPDPTVYSLRSSARPSVVDCRETSPIMDHASGDHPCKEPP